MMFDPGKVPLSWSSRKPPGRGLRRRLVSFVAGMLAVSFEQAWAREDVVPTFPREGLVLTVPGRGDRSIILVDPISARLVEGSWSMPAKDEAVTFKDGQTRRWQTVQATPEGAFAIPDRRGYLALEVSLADERIMVLDASGHSLVYVNGKPRVGDPYANGYVHLPVKLQHGVNTFLFQVGRNPRVVARLSAPKAAALLNVDDVTVPDLVVGEPVDTEAAIVVSNTSQRWARSLEIVSKLPDGEEIRTSVPPLPPLSVRKLGFRIKGPAVVSSGKLPLSLILKDSAGSSTNAVDTATLSLQVRSPGQARKRTFRSQIDGSVQYYGLVPARRCGSIPRARRRPMASVRGLS